MKDRQLVKSLSSPIRARLKWEVAAVPMLVPATIAVVAATYVVRAPTISGRVSASIAAAVFAAFVVNFLLTYRLELKNGWFRRVRPFWLGTQEISVTDITGVIVRSTGPFRARRIQFESTTAQIRLMWRSQRYGSAWRVTELRRLIAALAEHGVNVDASVDEFLALPT